MSFVPEDLPQLPPREAESHKGTYGRALLIGGSRGMSGAIAMAGMACLRSGAGLVKLATPDACLDTVAGFEPSFMTAPLPCDEAGRISLAAKDALGRLAAGQSCIGLGPGIGRSADLTELIGWLYDTLEMPVVVDADALNALAERGFSRPPAPRILTPHPGEFRRLVGDESLSLDAQPDRAVQLADELGVVVVLKGHRTLITDGRRSARNTSGNPGMATGGSGDVLTGVITALVCQGLRAFEAAQLGVYVHGLAGDLAAEEYGEVSMIASDLLDLLPEAFQELAE
ncbi:MAG: NAD(P)H-hydrate dehydratase [Pirellulaceae bacterium]